MLHGDDIEGNSLFLIKIIRTQSVSERSCFVLPPASEIKFTVQNEERSGALISINEPELPNVCPVRFSSLNSY